MASQKRSRDAGLIALGAPLLLITILLALSAYQPKPRKDKIARTTTTTPMM